MFLISMYQIYGFYVPLVRRAPSGDSCLGLPWFLVPARAPSSLGLRAAGRRVGPVRREDLAADLTAVR